MGDIYPQEGVVATQTELISSLELGYPVDINKDWGGKSVKECRVGELERLTGLIDEFPQGVLVRTVARSGNTSFEKGLAQILKAKGYKVIEADLLGLAGTRRQLETFLEVTDEKGDLRQRLVILFDEAGQVATKQEDDENQASDKEDLYEILAEGIERGQLTPVFFIHNGSKNLEEPNNADILLTSMQEKLNISSLADTNLEVMNKESLLHLFDIHPLHDHFPKSLKEARGEVVEYVWGPLQLNKFVVSYVKNCRELSHEEALKQAKRDILSGFDLNNPLDDVIRTTGGEEIVRIIKKVGTGFDWEQLSDEEKRWIKRYDFTHIFTIENNRVRVGAGCLIDFVKGEN